MYYASQGMGGLAALEEGVAPSFLGKLKKPKVPKPKPVKTKKSRFAQSTGCQPGLIQNPDGTCVCPAGQVMTPNATCVQAGGFSAGVSKTWLQQVMSTPSPGAGGGGSGVIVSTTSAGPGVTAEQYAAAHLPADTGGTFTWMVPPPSLGPGGYGGGGGGPMARPGIPTYGGGGGGGAKCPPGTHFTGGGCCPNGMDWNAALNACAGAGGGGGGGGGGVRPRPPVAPGGGGGGAPAGGGGGGPVDFTSMAPPEDTYIEPVKPSYSPKAPPSLVDSSNFDFSASSTMFTSSAPANDLEGFDDFNSSLPWIAAGLLLWFLVKR